MPISTAGLVMLLLTALSISGCKKQDPASPEVRIVTISIDMPKDQTLQFLRQSASTIKLQGLEATAEDAIVTETSKVLVSGPASGPVTAVLSGDGDSVSKWSQMILDKLPSNKL